MTDPNEGHDGHDEHDGHRGQTIMHLVAAIVVIIKGLTKLSHGLNFKAVLILGLGALMLWMALKHHWLEERFPKLIPFFFLFEAVVVGLIAWSSWGKTYAYLYIVAAAGYVVAFGVAYAKQKKGAH